MSTTTLAAEPGHLVQLRPAAAADLLEDWYGSQDDDECLWYPAIDRNVDQIAAGDLVYFWVSGAGDAAGLVGVGVATGEFEELEHARNYADPEGLRSLRNSAEVSVVWVTDKPVITRTELKRLDLFIDFDLFRMPRRANAFTVTREQAAVFNQRLTAVIG
ncbi:EVE domain-containing protein [Cellulomonas humilata]|nr:EVE domain-containing protein [Cellulomonas humilata]